MKDSQVYLTHILESAEAILAYVRDVDKRGFLASPEKQDAVIRRFEIIGEASKRLSEKTKLEDSSIPWRHVASMRDRLIHEYFAVDMEFVWRTAKHDLPTFVERVRKLLEIND